MNHGTGGGLMALALVGCAALPPPLTETEQEQLWQAHAAQVAQLQNWDLHGRIGLQWGERSLQGRLQWRQRGSKFEVVVAGPFSSHRMRMTGDFVGGQITLHQNDRQVVGPIEQVTEQVLGVALPLAMLADLVRGVPQVAAGQRTLDGKGYARQANTDGWQIDYHGYTCCEPPALPERVSFNHESMRGAIAIRSWSRL